MANKRNQVRKKSALARRRAGKTNGMKGGYSGFRGYRKNPENISSSQKSYKSCKAGSKTSQPKHNSDQDNTDDHEPYVIFLEVEVGKSMSEPTDDAVVNTGKTKQNKRQRKQLLQVRC